jgi:predicted dehydrogenase
MVGYGFMGRTHSNAYKRLNDFFDVEHRPVLKAACARKREKVEAFAANWGYERVETDWRALVEADDIDLIDIGAPNRFHHDIAIAAAQAGKMVLCEKPLAMSVEEAERMTEAVEKAGVPNMVWFNYRRVPSIALAKQIVDEGRIGRPFHYRAEYLQDWTIAADVPQGGAGLWRLDAAVAGSGVTGDLLAHSIDTAMWLNGAITRVVAKTETFVKQRKHAETGKVEPVGIDDACMFLAEFANGSMGTTQRQLRCSRNLDSCSCVGNCRGSPWSIQCPIRTKTIRTSRAASSKAATRSRVSSSSSPVRAGSRVTRAASRAAASRAVSRNRVDLRSTPT